LTATSKGFFVEKHGVGLYIPLQKSKVNFVYILFLASGGAAGRKGRK
jgi:hypothetical protein